MQVMRILRISTTVELLNAYDFHRNHFVRTIETPKDVLLGNAVIARDKGSVTYIKHN
jgi:hypothetical protein